MTRAIDIIPFSEELPSHFADRLGILYAQTVTAQHKKDKGQFFTPTAIARFMAALVPHTREKIRILDPGCGTAILSSAFIETIIRRGDTVREIELVLYETDSGILPFTQFTLNYLETWLEKQNVKFKTTLKTSDFVLDNQDCFVQTLSLFHRPQNAIFDVVISNPPYFKISKEDQRAIVAKSIVWGQPNIYAIFLMTAAKLLKEGGVLVFIVPRSFAAGNYFRAFRQAFFEAIDVQQIHLFNSRTETFNRDSVLQETLILKGIKQLSGSHSSSILLTHSKGISDLDNPAVQLYQKSELIDFETKEQILHLPSSEVEDRVIKLFKSWRGNLHQYGLQISTGPVVSFRASEYLYEQFENGTKTLVPLLQLINTGKMAFVHPVFKKGKPQYIQHCEATGPLLLMNKNYVLLRRFSAKDDKSRLVAAPYFSDFTEAEFIGIENHLNYIYRPKGELTQPEMLGLAGLLNSKLFDTYFRTFNGNINVSATELREMPLPPLEDIVALGNQLLQHAEHSQSRIDEVVNRFFELEFLFTHE